VRDVVRGLGCFTRTKALPLGDSGLQRKRSRLFTRAKTVPLVKLWIVKVMVWALRLFYENEVSSPLVICDSDL